MKKLFALFLLVSVQIFAQIKTQPSKPAVKDPFFGNPPATQQNNHKRLMNEFHYAALKRMNQLQYSEDLLHSMVQQ